MKEFTQIKFDIDQCRSDLDDFQHLLASKTDLEEGQDIKPFFEAHPHLSAFIGSQSLRIATFDLLAHQYQLFGDFSCDLVVGDSIRKEYGFVEWEDGSSSSLFRYQGKKATPEWSTRLEHGLSQLIDWFWKLDDMARTQDFTSRFGKAEINYFGLLVIGRDHCLTHPRERQRWQWRHRKTRVNSLEILCMTYDELYISLRDRSQLYPPTTAPITK